MNQNCQHGLNRSMFRIKCVIKTGAVVQPVNTHLVQACHLARGFKNACSCSHPPSTDLSGCPADTPTTLMGFLSPLSTKGLSGLPNTAACKACMAWGVRHLRRALLLPDEL